MKDSISAILFDLGGVLIDFVGISEVGKLTPEKLSFAETRQRWIASESLKSYETGKISTSRFSQRFVDEWQLPLAPVEFLETFKSWINGPLPGAPELFEKLSPHYTLACLSNTSEAHWEFMLKKASIDQLIEHKFASHLIGAMKPDPSCYTFVCKEMSLRPEQIVFFDDGEENIAGAKNTGMHAYLVKGPDDVHERLLEIGLIK